MTAGVHDFPLGPAEEVPDFGNQPDSDTPPRKVYTCDVCGTELEYGGRGRPPTRCEEHKRDKSTPTTSRGQSRGRSSKAEREAAELALKFRTGQQKLGLITSSLEPYDGMVIFTTAKPIWDQGENLLAGNDILRGELLKIRAGGSVGAFAATVIVTLLLPIAAHHGVIPSKVKGYPIGEALEKLPLLMTKLEKAAEDAGNKIAEELARQEKEARERKEQEQAARDQAEGVPAT